MAKLQSGTRIYGTANVDTSIAVGSSFTANTLQVTLSGIPLSANGSTGSATQVLTSNGSTGSPYWASASGGGFTNGASIAVSNLAFWNSASSARAYTYYNSTQNSVDLIFI
jgi:hypothetical protein